MADTGQCSCKQIQNNTSDLWFFKQKEYLYPMWVKKKHFISSQKFVNRNVFQVILHDFGLLTSHNSIPNGSDKIFVRSQKLWDLLYPNVFTRVTIQRTEKIALLTIGWKIMYVLFRDMGLKVLLHLCDIFKVTAMCWLPKCHQYSHLTEHFLYC